MARGASSALAPPLTRLRRGELGVTAIAVVLLVLFATFVVWPLVRVLGASVSSAGVVGSWRLVGILVNSLLVAVVSTVITVTIALVLAYTVCRTDIPGKRFMSLVSLLPLISPPFLVALALLLVLGRNGLVGQALGLDWSIEGFPGIVAAQVFTFLPPAYVVLAKVLANIDPALEEAAENLGAGPVTTLRRVTLVLARPGLVSAALVVFILCLSDFGNPILIGGRFAVLTTEIYAQVVAKKDFATGATASLVLLVPCLAVYLAHAHWSSSVIVTAAADTAPRPMPRGLRVALFVTTAGVAVLVTIVHGLIPLASLVRSWGSDWTVSLEHYAFASTEQGAWPIWNSVQLAVLAAAVGTALALVTAYVTRRRRPPGAPLLEFLSRLPAAVPGTVIGLGYVLAFDGPPLRLTGTMWILVASVVFWKLPVAMLAATRALDQIDLAIEEVAVSLGAGTSRTFAQIVVPLLTSPGFSIFGFFFIEALVTVSAVIFLVFPGFNLASVAMLDQVENGNLGMACALGTMLLAIGASAVLLLRALVGGDRAAILR